MNYTRYISSDDALLLNYKDGVLINMITLKEDKVAFEALRHYIALYEKDIPKNFFKPYEGSV